MVLHALLLSFLFTICAGVGIREDVVFPDNTELNCVNTLNEIKSRLNMLDQKFDECTQRRSCRGDNIDDQIIINADNENIVRNCFELKSLHGYNKSGVYRIKPLADTFEVYCDMVTLGGGWTVFQRRHDGSVNFYRNWTEYETGFGDVFGEYWLGLQKIYQLTSNQPILRIELEDFKHEHKYATYAKFNIGNSEESYSLKTLGAYTGTAGDSLNAHKEMKFSTHDKDHDKSGDNCAEKYQGAWWYNSCHNSNLNGIYHVGDVGNELWAKVMVWGGFVGYTHSLKTARMMIR